MVWNVISGMWCHLSTEGATYKTGWHLSFSRLQNTRLEKYPHASHYADRAYVFAKTRYLSS